MMADDTRPTDPLVLRRATPDDIPQLRAVIDAAYSEHRGRLDPPSSAYAETGTSLHALLASGEEAFLALDGAQVLACVFSVQNGVESYAHRLAVAPAWRQRGLGRVLMATAEDRARGAGCTYMRVGVRLALPGNIAFFERLGYRSIGAASHSGYAAPTFQWMTKEIVSLEMRQVQVLPYDPLWAKQFQIEADRLSEVLADQLVAIHPIGSTSVPGSVAKPIIDIMPVVRDIRAMDHRLPAMARLGYTPRGEYGLSGRRYFFKGTGTHRTHHVHIYASDNPEVERHLAFRDYLRCHPEAANAYGQLKLSLAAAYPADIVAYMDGKDGPIKELEAAALAWRATQRGSVGKQQARARQ